VISLTSSTLLHVVMMTSYCCQRYVECLVTTLCSSRTVQQLNYCIKKRQTFLCPTCGLQTAQFSVLWITKSGLSGSIMSTTDKSIVWMNWNGSSLMSGVVLNSWFLTSLLTSGEEDIECVSMLKEDISSTACEQTTFGYIQCDLFDCYIFNYAIMTATLANTFLFILQGSTVADLKYGIDFRVHVVIVNFCLQQWKNY